LFISVLIAIDGEAGADLFTAPFQNSPTLGDLL